MNCKTPEFNMEKYHNTGRPLLSIVICGRNDNYLGDFKYRITTCINYFAKSAGKINKLDQVELIVVDWNGDTPLHEALVLIDEARQISKFIVVPPSIASKYMHKDSRFDADCAMNAGIRRANGEYIMIMPADILIPPLQLMNLLLVLNREIDTIFNPEKSMLNIGIKRIPWQIVNKKLTLFKLDRYLQLCSRHLSFDVDFMGLCGSYGGYLMHRHIWSECQGLREDLHGWGWSDVDLGLRISRKYPLLDLISFGIYFYDMSQKPSLRPVTIKESHQRWSVIMDSFNTGINEWGLFDQKLQTHYSKCTPAFELTDVSLQVHKPDTTQTCSSVSMKYIHNKIDKFIFHNILMFLLLKGKREWTILYLMGWYISLFWPEKYLECGILKEGCLFPFVKNLFPGIEIYGIGEWKLEKETSKLFSAFKSSFSQGKNFRGYAHFFLTNENNTSNSKEIPSVLFDETGFGLILFRVDFFPGDMLSKLEEAVDRLSEDGAIIISGKNNESWEEVWEYAQQNYSEFGQFVLKNLNVGILLKPCYGKNEQVIFSKRQDKMIQNLKLPKVRIRVYSLLAEILNIGRRIRRKIRTKPEAGR